MLRVTLWLIPTQSGFPLSDNKASSFKSFWLSTEGISIVGTYKESPSVLKDLGVPGKQSCAQTDEIPHSIKQLINKIFLIFIGLKLRLQRYQKSMDFFYTFAIGKKN
jgi:hypothetical protein